MPKVLGKGQVVIPAKLRKRYGLLPGRLVVVEPRGDGVLVRPTKDIIDELYGKYEGVFSTKDLLASRRKEVLLEEQKLKSRLTRGKIRPR